MQNCLVKANLDIKVGTHPTRTLELNLENCDKIREILYDMIQKRETRYDMISAQLLTCIHVQTLFLFTICVKFLRLLHTQ